MKKIPLAEGALATFLLSAFYKSATIEWPIDVTLLTGVLVILSAAWRSYKVRLFIPKGLIWFLPLIVAGLLTALFTDWNEYGMHKFQMVYSTVAVAAVCSPIIVRDSKSLRRLGYAMIGMTLAGILIASPTLDISQRLTFFGTGSIGLGRSIGITALIAFVLALRHRAIIHTLVCAVLLFFAVATGNKQGVYAMAIVSVAAMAVSPSRPRRKLLIVLIAVCAFFGTTLLTSTYMPQPSIHRLTSISAEASSVTGRIYLLETAAIAPTLLGRGWGSYVEEDAHLGDHNIDWPHNIYAEAWYELGILGLASLLLLTLIALRRAKRSVLLFALLLFSTLVACVSGDLHGNKMFFAFAGIALCWKSA